MSFRHQPPSYAEPLPHVEPMDDESIPRIVHEFRERHLSRVNLGVFENERGAVFTLAESPTSVLFAFEMNKHFVHFVSRADFSHGSGGQERVSAVIAKVLPSLAIGSLCVTDKGVEWSWEAPSLRYPYFHGITENAIGYSEYHTRHLWPTLRSVSEGTISVEAAVESILQKDGEQVPCFNPRHAPKDYPSPTVETMQPKLRSITWEVSDNMDAILLVAPKDTLPGFNDTARLVIDNLVARETLIPYLAIVTKPSEVDEDEIGPGYLLGLEDYRLESAVVRFTTNMVNLINGQQGEESLAFSKSLRPVAAKLKEWPAVVGKAKLDPSLQTLIGLGSESGKYSLIRKTDNPITRETDKILDYFVSFFDQIPEARKENFSSLFGYLAEEPPPISRKNWAFWKQVASDLIDERFGPPEVVAAIREKRTAHEKQRLEKLGLTNDWLLFRRDPTLNTQELARQKLLRPPHQPTQNSQTEDLKNRRISAWQFSSKNKLLRDHVQSRNNLKKERSYFGRFKREVLNSLATRIRRLSVGAK